MSEEENNKRSNSNLTFHKIITASAIIVSALFPQITISQESVDSPAPVISFGFLYTGITSESKESSSGKTLEGIIRCMNSELVTACEGGDTNWGFFIPNINQSTAFVFINNRIEVTHFSIGDKEGILSVQVGDYSLSNFNTNNNQAASTGPFLYCQKTNNNINIVFGGTLYDQNKGWEGTPTQGDALLDQNKLITTITGQTEEGDNILSDSLYTPFLQKGCINVDETAGIGQVEIEETNSGWIVTLPEAPEGDFTYEVYVGNAEGEGTEVKTHPFATVPTLNISRGALNWEDAFDGNEGEDNVGIFLKVTRTEPVETTGENGEVITTDTVVGQEVHPLGKIEKNAEVIETAISIEKGTNSTQEFGNAIVDAQFTLPEGEEAGSLTVSGTRIQNNMTAGAEGTVTITRINNGVLEKLEITVISLQAPVKIDTTDTNTTDPVDTDPVDTDPVDTDPVEPDPVDPDPVDPVDPPPPPPPGFAN